GFDGIIRSIAFENSFWGNKGAYGACEDGFDLNCKTEEVAHSDDDDDDDRSREHGPTEDGSDLSSTWKIPRRCHRVLPPLAIKKVWEYVKLHNLQNPANKREIFCDEKLKSIFPGKDAVGFQEVTKLLSIHFVKSG
ncbi:zinc finger CCCH domain-containing protein 19-like, partial [Juglans microcarpa x Juglans regia]|uniref:zinc finger CCCH domain-containing protein 19-like n=1 Tax=Juglans microcarpa x Juglans regia TaxID=2249226 RepID=UPI001B7DD268